MSLLTARSTPGPSKGITGFLWAWYATQLDFASSTLLKLRKGGQVKHLLVLAMVACAVLCACTPGALPTAPPTATPMPTYTSYPTYTARPSATATALPTYTPYPTFTSPPTATTIPSNTPVPPTHTPRPTAHTVVPRGKLAYTVNRGTREYDIYLIDVDGSDKQLLVADAGFPSFSQDGQEIMFYTWDGNGVEIMKLDGSNRRRFLNDGEAAYAHVGSDGYSVVYRAGNINWQRWQFDLKIYVIGLDGQGKRMITEGDQPDWNPKAMQFACRTCDGSHCGLFVINSDGSGRRMVSQEPDDQNPDWAPDGRRIAFSSHRDGNWEIYVMNADGSNHRRLTDNPATDAVPVWLSDGEHMVFRSDRGGVWAIYLMRSDGTGVAKIVDANSDPIRWPWEGMAVFP